MAYCNNCSDDATCLNCSKMHEYNYEKKACICAKGWYNKTDVNDCVSCEDYEPHCEECSTNN